MRGAVGVTARGQDQDGSPDGRCCLGTAGVGAGRVTAAVGTALATKEVVAVGCRRHITVPRWPLLPSGFSVVVIPITEIIKIGFFFPPSGGQEQLQPWCAWILLPALEGGHGGKGRCPPKPDLEGLSPAWQSPGTEGFLSAR